MSKILKRLADALNEVDRVEAEPGTQRRRADGRVWTKQPDGSWTPEVGSEGQPSEADQAPLAPDELEQISAIAARDPAAAGQGASMADADGSDPEALRETHDMLRQRAREGTLSPAAAGYLAQAHQSLTGQLEESAGALPYAPLGDDVERAVPSPSGGESQDEFVSRCMSSLADTDADRPQDQRLAMCFRAFREDKEARGEPVTAAELMKEAKQNAGYLMKIAGRMNELRKQGGSPPARQEEVGTTGIDPRIEGVPEAFLPDGIDKAEDGADHRIEGAPEKMTEEVIDT